MQSILTPKKKEILDFVSLYQTQKGYSPSQEEIRKKLKLPSKKFGLF